MDKMIMILLIFAVLAEAVYIAGQVRVIQFLKNDARKLRQGQGTVFWEEGESDRLSLLKKKVELSTLQNQINPHFLYNTLDSIRSKALIEGQGEIATMTEVLARFFRYCIGNRENLVQLREEIDHIQDYFYIQKFRFEDRFDLGIEVKDPEMYDMYLPKMTLQPIVENAMIHGLEKVNRKGKLKIDVDKIGEILLIIVSDNGYGMSEDDLVSLNAKMGGAGIKISISGKHNGIAISNVNSRLKLTFGEEYGINYKSMQDVGTEVEIRIPLVNDFQRIKYEDRI